MREAQVSDNRNCPSCGSPVEATSNFCSACGAALPRTDSGPAPASVTDTTRVIPAITEEDLSDLDHDEQAAVESLPPGHALLIVKRGPGDGRYLLAKDHVTAGRSPDSDIFLDDITVSRHHVTFLRTPEGTVVQDQGSLNGTYVNRTLCDGDVRLRQGDEVQIGKFRMVFYASSHGA
ncbi:FHA domain-containing protein [Parenemella sanctibonifatiensis]|uniref:Histidine kinase n=1 Tax=Parenemella sanctibonifatiensis TaxID=2016505 RepID=A0A255EIW3_9ACTN|nr:histidine kinase [Parenemella sanctibonifatiensis]